MTDNEFYWTVVAALGGAGWAIVSALRDRKAQVIAQSRAIIDRLLEGDRISIDNPGIQKYLSSSALENEDYFRRPEILTEELFFKSKAYVYYQLNLFDEILSIAAANKTSHFLLKPPEIIELEDWEAYIKHKLAHPLYRSILRNEGAIFGGALKDFWKKHEAALVASTPDRFSW